jgi:hypothetical protein
MPGTERLESDAKSDTEVEQLAIEVQEILYTLTERFSRDRALIQQQTEEVSLTGVKVLALLVQKYLFLVFAVSQSEHCNY